MTATRPEQSNAINIACRIFAGCFGAFLGLSLLKFGNPPIMEKWVTAPANIWEFLLGYPWPISWAYWMLAVLALFGLAVSVRPSPLALRPSISLPLSWLVALPLFWLLWQCLSAINSVDADLSKVTLKHFAACVACFYLGFFSLRNARLSSLWSGLLIGLILVMVAGFQQHLGGLEETKRYFEVYLYSKLHEFPEGYLKKISSNRIFGTLFYPNALAGCLLLLLPGALVTVWRLFNSVWSARAVMTDAARTVLAGMVALAGVGFFGAAMACLFWSGSKGGWLLMLLLGLLIVLKFKLSKSLKISLLCLILVAGIAGFLWKYSGFFQKGATSVVARFDYWRAAVHTFAHHPLLGTGPGTFGRAYEQIKRPESEMAWLAHNDYLEQASDSGLIGFLTFSALVVGGLIWSFGGRIENGARTAMSASAWASYQFPIWLGLLGWACQSFMEFGLYIPALAWPAFTFLGWSLGHQSLPSASASAASSSSKQRR